MSKHLFILPRRGLFLSTACQNCGHIFVSQESDTTLITVRSSTGKLEMLDPTTQMVSPYPTSCPVCNQTTIKSLFSGAEDLLEKISEHLTTNVTPLYSTKKNSVSHSDRNIKLEQNYQTYEGSIDISTRYYDPGLDYSVYTTVVLVQAEGALSSPDYLASEDLYRSITKLFYALTSEQTLIVDTSDTEHPLTTYINTLSSEGFGAYLDIISHELVMRQKFGLPPNTHIVLCTSQQKNKTKALELISQAKKRFDVAVGMGSQVIGPYPAKMLKRKNMYAYHLAIHVPKNSESLAKLRIILLDTAKDLGLQIRLNPKHLF